MCGEMGVPAHSRRVRAVHGSGPGAGDVLAVARAGFRMEGETEPMCVGQMRIAAVWHGSRWADDNCYTRAIEVK